MKIIRLTAENIKKLVAVEITPQGNVVQITGKNGQGKTSVLDAIWWALAGAKNIQSTPIRKGQDRAQVRLDMGDVIVTRSFLAPDEDHPQLTTAIIVENADGARFPSPQSVLDGFIGELSFDPLEFSRKKPREQFDALKKFVPGFDFDKSEVMSKQDFDSRRDINKETKRLRAAAESIQVTEGVEGPRVDESLIMDKIVVAERHNSDIEKRMGIARERQASVDAMKKQVEELQSSIRATEPLIEYEFPEKISISDLREAHSSAQKLNEALKAKEKRDSLMAQAEESQKASDVLTKRMEEREKEKQQAISSATFPISGLGFGDGEILLNNLPLEQASDAEKLSVSVSIAMAMNPKLRVLRIRDGSLLDDDSMAILTKTAKEKDFQIWIERVDTSGSVGFVLEDGSLKKEKENA